MEVEYVYRVPHPFCSVLYKSCPEDESRRDVIAIFLQPMTEERCRAHLLQSMIDSTSTITDLRRFQQTIFGQDKPILENQYPKRLPLDPRAETPDPRRQIRHRLSPLAEPEGHHLRRHPHGVLRHAASDGAVDTLPLCGEGSRAGGGPGLSWARAPPHPRSIKAGGAVRVGQRDRAADQQSRTPGLAIEPQSDRGAIPVTADRPHDPLPFRPHLVPHRQFSDDLPFRHVYQGQLLGRELAVWRADDGNVNVWENRCLHRGVRLSIGVNEGGELKCQYHGWRYANRSAGCTYIPAHPADAPARRIENRTYPVREAFGLDLVRRQ